MKLSQTKNDAPLRTIVFPRDGFSDNWSGKPHEDVAIGLRLLSESDIQQARSEATKQAIQWYEGREGECIDEDSRTDSFNDSLIRFAVARGTCDPNNKSKAYFDLAEETVRLALTSEGARFIWDELIRLHIGTGVNITPISLEDLRDLARRLQSGGVEMLPPAKKLEVRKLLTHCLDALRAVMPEDEAADDPDAPSVFVARRA